MVASNHKNFTHEIYFTTNNSVMSMTAHFHTAPMRLFYVTVMAPLRYLDGVPDGSRGALRLYQYIPVTHDSGSKPWGSRSHQRQQQEARTFASSCFPDILLNMAPMNAASLFVLRTYMVDSFVSVTEPVNEGYRRIYPLENFRRYAQTTKNLLHKKRTPKNFTTRKFPDLR